MHRVAIVALDGLVLFDLAAPAAVFGCVRLPDGRPGYDVRLCGPRRSVEADGLRLGVRHGLDELARADTIVLPGLNDPDAPVPEALLRAVRDAAAAGARVASICSGAFLLAATGLLDGRRATTHWLASDELARRHPRVRVDPDVLYVDEGRVLTSAGAAAAFDLCLHMVRCDHGAAVALDAARRSVMPLEREGGQSQFIAAPPPPPEGSSLAPLLSWLEAHLDEPLRLDEIARRGGMSVRSLSRHFRAQVGTTPLRWLLRARLRRAQMLLETTRHPVERIAHSAGFGSATALRERFRRELGTSPRAYRRAFHGRP